ncbi:MAG: amidase [Thermicanus sp.]|nr:amidase [Thermicanus sp.]
MSADWNAFVQEDVIIEPYKDGRLRGLTFAVKDVFAIKGYTNGAGNPDWLRSHKPAEKNAVVVDLLLAQGARLKGITHTDELMFSLNGENYHYGTPINPKAPGCIPGGSSSGSAVAVSSGSVDFALGTDTGGSVRIPSAYCGIYGFRPTHGSVPLDGVIPLSQSFDTVGWMARDAKTLLRVGEALFDGMEETEGEFQQILFGRDAWEMVEEDCRTSFFKSIPLFERMTEKSEWITVAPQGLPELFKTFRTIQGYEIWSNHGKWIRDENPRFGPDIAERFAWTSTLSDSEFEKARPLQEQFRSYMHELLGSNRLLVIPTSSCTPPKRGLTGDQVEDRRTRTLQLTCIAGLSELPQVTLPMEDEEGLPFGISIIAGHRQDLKLLSWVHEKWSVPLTEKGEKLKK